jgi:hypothetical protein
MKPLSFSIASPATFRDVDSDQLISFNRDANGLRYHWQGAGVDKSGDCHVVHENGFIYLDLYTGTIREIRYLVTILDTDKELVTGFTLKDRPGNVKEFRATEIVQ